VCTVFGCGVDVEELVRFDRYAADGNDSIMRGICSEREYDSLYGNRRVRFALSFSCKEAFLKALGAGWPNGSISWRDIELLFDGPELRECCVHLHGSARDIVARNNLQVGEASFTYNDDYALFQVVLLAGDVRAESHPETLGDKGADDPVCRPRFCCADGRSPNGSS